MTQNNQGDKARIWLARHGIVAAPAGAVPHDLPAPLLQAGAAASEDDWATDAQQWYLQRAQGVDVAQLLPYHQIAGK